MRVELRLAEWGGITEKLGIMVWAKGTERVWRTKRVGRTVRVEILYG